MNGIDHVVHLVVDQLHNEDLLEAQQNQRMKSIIPQFIFCWLLSPHEKVQTVDLSRKKAKREITVRIVFLLFFVIMICLYVRI